MGIGRRDLLLARRSRQGHDVYRRGALAPNLLSRHTRMSMIALTPTPLTRLKALAARLQSAKGADVWCIFDNTALGAATKNALEMGRLLEPRIDLA